MISAFFKFIKIMRKERPDYIISTGSEIAIPPFLIAKMTKAKTVFIESWCRTKTRSGTGKILYPFADLFLVQWPELLHHYGPKARYEGGVA